MKKQKKIISMILALTLITLVGMPNYHTRVYASEIGKHEDIIQNQEVQIIAYDSQNERSLARIYIHNSNADVYGNGVRLRSAPNTSATILELMYDGEYVWIDWSEYGRGEGGSSWYHIQRTKTGTYGWVSCNYVGPRD